ncbi:hypothetical protein UFOVP395_129 [uncultured Caudovirales phage]|jgi:hypothetical protein|uniref:Uncharacterized protein n=1 Tax=uncultured Caudovirales phage TaxID=2100421 RepID=A0A6J5M221_9CAUD|nr:hypothetical protein UFOVP395_129 [uncultured Caudovirales phage]
MKIGVAEILKKASEIKDDAARVEWLRVNSNPTVHTILRYAYDPKIVWQLPEGAPPYKPNDLVDQQHRLYTELRKLYLFVEGGNPNLKPLRREQLFIELLEVVDPEDAKLLLAVKEKTIPYPGITKQVVQKAFPGLV